MLDRILPEYKEYKEIIQVYDLRGEGLTLYSDVRNEKAVLGQP